LFALMMALLLAMTVALLHERFEAADRFAAATAPLPLSAMGGPVETVRLLVARDRDGVLQEETLPYPLPPDRTARARVVLAKLLEQYTGAASGHPLHSSAGVQDVFLLRVPGSQGGGALLAVVNLSPSFVLNHPSGVEVESLTLLSMIATLHANLPEVAQVRFLVDGAPRATLAGHADLSHAFLAAGTDFTMGAHAPEEDER
jgi:hypothetical protein